MLKVRFFISFHLLSVFFQFADSDFVCWLKTTLPFVVGLSCEISSTRPGCWRKKIGGHRKHFSFRYYGGIFEARIQALRYSQLCATAMTPITSETIPYDSGGELMRIALPEHTEENSVERDLHSPEFLVPAISEQEILSLYELNVFHSIMELKVPRLVPQRVLIPDTETVGQPLIDYSQGFQYNCIQQQ